MEIEIFTLADFARDNICKLTISGDSTVYNPDSKQKSRATAVPGV